MKVTQILYRSGSVGWKADLGYINQKRVVRFFPTREDAENYLRDAKSTLKTQGTDTILLSSADRILFSKWKEQLAAAGSNIEEAASTFLKWKIKLEMAGAGIEQAGQFFLTHHSGIKESPPIVQLGWDYLSAMLAGDTSSLNSEKTVNSLKRPNLNSFFRFLSTEHVEKITDVNRGHIEKWLERLEGAAETKRNRVRTVRHFLEWARRNRYIAINPLMGKDNAIEIGEEKRGDILSYGPKEMSALLKKALFGKHRSKHNAATGTSEYVSYRQFMGYLAAALFCGLRPEEINRTPITNLDLVGRRLVVTGKASKTNKPRVIELSRVATAWFRLWRKCYPHQKTLMPDSFPGRWRAIRAAAGIPSLHDGLRHTFASMHYAMHQNAAQLQAVMGHDETQDTLFAHYRAVKTTNGEWITKKMAQEFWSLMPSKIRGAKSRVPAGSHRK